MIIVKELQRRQEKMEEQRQQSDASNIRNNHSKAPSQPGAPMGGDSQTVEYVNESVTDG